MGDDVCEKKRPIRKAMRLKGYDYSRGGCYFVTICVRDRKAILSKVFPVRQKEPLNRVGTGVLARPQYAVKLSAFGKIVEETISYIDAHYDAVQIDKYCIMPDHIHLLITLQSDDLIGQDRRGYGYAITSLSAPQTFPLSGESHLSLRDVVRQFKTYTTKRCSEATGDNSLLLWQPRYYDHIIRNDEDYCEKWRYIDENPIKYLYSY